MAGAEPVPDQMAMAAVIASSPWPFTHFAVTIDRTNKNERLGVNFQCDFDTDNAWERLGPIVDEVRDGGLLAAEAKVVKPKDVLFQVNGVHGDQIGMIQEIKTKQVITLHFVRVEVPLDAQSAGSKGKPSGGLPQIPNKKKNKTNKKTKKEAKAAEMASVQFEASYPKKVVDQGGAAVQQLLAYAIQQTSGLRANVPLPAAAAA